jgi:hypothetical protein
VHAGGEEREVVEECVPPPVDELPELELGFVEGESERGELRGEDQLEREVCPEAHPERHVGA